MILAYNNNKKYFIELLDIIENVKDSDFYFTHDNKRRVINNSDSLKKILKEASHVYFLNDEINRGMVLVWKSIGGEVKRNYVKILADSKSTATSLLTYLLWNFNKELHVKIRKDSKIISSYKENGFKFLGGRGTQILLNKKNKYVRT